MGFGYGLPRTAEHEKDSLDEEHWNPQTVGSAKLESLDEMRRSPNPLAALAMIFLASSPAASWQVPGNGIGHFATASAHRRAGRPRMGADTKPDRLPVGVETSRLALGRRAALLLAVTPVVTTASVASADEEKKEERLRAPDPNNFEKFQRANNSLGWFELKEGTGDPVTAGETITIDYMMTRRGAGKIYSTLDSGIPYTWKLGDGTTIPGLEQGILGGEGTPPMLRGGARRLLIPKELGYGITELTNETGTYFITSKYKPVPPEGFSYKNKQMETTNVYEKFKFLYLNDRLNEQPDLILDVRFKQLGAPAVTKVRKAPQVPAYARGPILLPDTSVGAGAVKERSVSR